MTDRDKLQEEEKVAYSWGYKCILEHRSGCMPQVVVDANQAMLPVKLTLGDGVEVAAGSIRKGKDEDFYSGDRIVFKADEETFDHWDWDGSTENPHAIALMEKEMNITFTKKS